ncbi:TPA: CSS-motif domain-containing protein, partial [Enterobacter bugandensis]|nr:CSS-motif domain-containing protein [Enterobacter bugandensis]
MNLVNIKSIKINYSNFFLLFFLIAIFYFLLVIRASGQQTSVLLENALISLDQIFGNASKAAQESGKYTEADCNYDALTGIRKIAAITPDIRSISIIRQDHIYCSSIFGNKEIIVDAQQFFNKKITFLNGNFVTPDSSLAVYSLVRPRDSKVLVV